jgi:uracil-DNA glycosylase family 4
MSVDNEQRKFDPRCRLCPRLAGHLDQVRDTNPDYFAAPVPAFGDPEARLLIVGLAPGYHGANRTGRPFTGDYAGVLLYKTLHALGMANRAESVNKPVGAEIRMCNRFLSAELRSDKHISVVLALGKIAHDAVLRANGLKLNSCRFAHGAEHQLADGRILVDSYHCSRYNTQTRRLTESMFVEVMARAQSLCGIEARDG